MAKEPKKPEKMEWSDLEKEVKKVLEELKLSNKMTYYRWPDSKMAGNYIKQAPADFLVHFRGDSLFIECKFSSVADSLTQCFANVDSHQLATAYMERRAGGSYWILFASATSNHYEVWSGTLLHTIRSNGKRISHNFRELVTSDLLEAVWFMLKNKSFKEEG